MKKSLVAVIISLLVAGTWDCKKSPTEVLPTEVLPSPTPVDVFPLAIGSTYRYSYQYENTNRVTRVTCNMTSSTQFERQIHFVCGQCRSPGT
jgi:hypothetical protein